MMSATIAVYCDACGCSAGFVTQAEVHDNEVEVPTRLRILSMDLCPNCHEKAKMAVKVALGLSPKDSGVVRTH